MSAHVGWVGDDWLGDGQDNVADNMINLNKRKIFSGPTYAMNVGTRMEIWVMLVLSDWRS